MSQEEFCSTLAFTKGPKTAKRTTFQDELEAVVTERAVRNRASYLNSNVFGDDDDDDDDDGGDVLKELLKTRRKKHDLFNASITKTSINDFKLSDDEEEENIKPKKVSFLKSQRNTNSLRSETLWSDAPQLDNLQSDPLRPDSCVISEVNEVQRGDRGQQDLRSNSPRNSQSESSTCRRSRLESPLPLCSENCQRDSISESVFEATPPTPAPRHRAPQSSVSGRDEAPSSRAAPSTVSDTFTSTFTFSSMSSQDGVSVMVNTHSRSLEGAESSDLSVEEHKEHKEHEEHQLISEVSPGTSRSAVSRPGSSRKSRSTKSFSAEPRYLGTLKVLEQKLCFQETGLDTADSLRATVYQDWLKKKEEKLQETFRVKKQEKLKEEEKTEKEASKKAEATASYEVWKEKKHATLKEKIRTKQEAMRKLQKEMDDKEERKETAKRIFEKWKREHDEILREQHKEQLQTENRLKEEKEKEKEQRRRDSSSSFNQWSVKKKEVMEEKLKSVKKKEVMEEKLKCERRQKEVEAMEEKYVKEEREKSALDMYEDWLKKKEFQQKQKRKEKQKAAGVFQEAPPPWSPANRTIPFGK